MTIDEFNLLQIGDIVYYYQPVNINKVSHISAALKKRKVKIIFEEDGINNRRVGFERGGVILMSILHMFDTDKDKLLAKKLVEIKSKIKQEVKSTNDRGCIIIKSKLETLFNQKNVIRLATKYPEIFI